MKSVKFKNKNVRERVRGNVGWKVGMQKEGGKRQLKKERRWDTVSGMKEEIRRDKL